MTYSIFYLHYNKKFTQLSQYYEMIFQIECKLYGLLKKEEVVKHEVHHRKAILIQNEELQKKIKCRSIEIKANSVNGISF